MKNKIPTEEQEQKALMQWAALTPFNHDERISDYLIHVPNGGSRNLLEAIKLKAMGVKAGVPDIFLYVPRETYHGLFIELKRRQGGVLSLKQRDMIIRLRNMGYAVEIAHGWEEAKAQITRYLGER